MSTPAESRANFKQVVRIILYTLGVLFFAYLSIYFIVVAANTKKIKCSATYDIDEGITKDQDIVMRWSFGKIDEAKTEITLNTTEKITDEQIDEFKKSIDESSIYKSTTYSDGWSYKITVDADYDLNQISSAFGGETIEDVKTYLEETLLMTCKEK